MLGKVGNTQLAFKSNKYKPGHKKKSGRNVEVHVDWFLHSPLPRAALPCLGWHGDWKRKLSASLSLATVSIYFTVNPLFNSFLKVKNWFDPVCVFSLRMLLDLENMDTKRL